MSSAADHGLRDGNSRAEAAVISPDMGGGFGSKIFLYFDMVLTLALAKRIGRPVKYVEDRSENYLSTTHGRDHITDLEVGATGDGKIIGMNVTTYANMGGYLSTFAPGIPTTLYGRMLSGCYKVPNIHCDVYGVYTNTAMVDAYRGAGRPEAAFVIERTCDLVAGATGVDPAEVRRRNFIQPEDFPYDNGVGMLPTTAGTMSRRLIGRSRPSGIGRCARSRSGGSTAERASCSASACHPTSKSAEWRRRNGSVSRAKAGALACGKAPMSRST